MLRKPSRALYILKIHSNNSQPSLEALPYENLGSHTPRPYLHTAVLPPSANRSTRRLRKSPRQRGTISAELCRWNTSHRNLRLHGERHRRLLRRHRECVARRRMFPRRMAFKLLRAVRVARRRPQHLLNRALHANPSDRLRNTTTLASLLSRLRVRRPEGHSEPRDSPQEGTRMDSHRLRL